MMAALRSSAIVVLLFYFVFPATAADNEAVAAIIKDKFAAGIVDTGSTSANAQLEAVRAYYNSRSYKPVWTRDTGPKGKAKALLAELKTSIVHGLSPEFYNVPEIEGLMEGQDAAGLARLDMLLSGSFADFANDLRNGRIGPDDAGAYNRVEPVFLDAAELVEGAAAAGNLRAYASNYLNADKRYVRLIAKLAQLMQIEQMRRWPAIAADGAEIAANADDPRMQKIRMLLLLNGDLPVKAPLDITAHDDVTVAAVKRFQARHGIEQSGNVDRATLAEMAVPLTGRIRQVLINLERRRWQNRDLGGDHLYVNLADDSIKLVLDGDTIGTYALHRDEGQSALPSFYGSVDKVLLDEAGNPAALAVTSPYLASIGGDAAPAIAVPQASRLAADIAEKLGDETGQGGEMVLKRPLTLFVTYVTAWATSDGQLFFRDDRFARDAVLAEKLALTQ